MSIRKHLPTRRPCETFAFECNGLAYVASIGRYPDGRIAEIFLSNGKAGSHADAAARDSAVVASIAFQFNVPVQVIRRALLRDARGAASSPLGVALDLLAGERTMHKASETLPALVHYDAACQALAKAVRVDEVKNIHDIAVAMRVYAKQAKNHEAEANAVVLRMRATRRLRPDAAGTEGIERAQRRHAWKSNQGSAG